MNIGSQTRWIDHDDEMAYPMGCSGKPKKRRRRKSRLSVVIRPAPTHYEIAARIGSHREAVTREFNRLEADGIVEVRRRQLRIVDIKRLQEAEE